MKILKVKTLAFTKKSFLNTYLFTFLKVEIIFFGFLHKTDVQSKIR